MAWSSLVPGSHASIFHTPPKCLYSIIIPQYKQMRCDNFVSLVKIPSFVYLVDIEMSRKMFRKNLILRKKLST